jgi:DNA-binding XRE family transcriptional regulator
MATGHDADRPALALFAAELRAARQHAGLTRDELSAKVNYSSSLIGMIETDYARAVLSTRPHTSADEIEELVTARLARQALLARADPPLLYVLLDEGVLYRPVGTPEVMAAQMARLADLSEQTYATLQVIPYSAGAHIGLQGGFAIADLPDLPGIVFLDSVADGQTVEDAAIVSQVTQRFDALRAEALPRGASRDMIRKVAEERWT